MILEKLDADDYRLGVPSTPSDITKVEDELQLDIPEEIKEFSLQVGWLEIDNCYFYGIPGIGSDEGSCVKMTIFARNEWNFPNSLVVIYSSEDEVLWYMDSKSSAVIAFDVFKREITGLVGDSLENVLIDYLSS